MDVLQLRRMMEILEYGNKSENFLKLKIFLVVMTDERLQTQKIREILFDMSRNCEYFPIPDLAKIIVSYVYEYPHNCVSTIDCGEIDSFIELKDGRFLCQTAGWGSLFICGEKGNYQYILSNILIAMGAFIELKDGKIAVGTREGEIIIYDRKFKRQIIIPTWKRHITTLHELKDGTIACGHYSEVQIMGLKTGVCLQTFFCDPHIIKIIELKDGRIAAGISNGVYIFSRNKHECVHLPICKHGGYLVSFNELMDGDIAIVTTSGDTERWNMKTADYVILEKTRILAQLPDTSLVILESENKIAIQDSMEYKKLSDQESTHVILTHNGGIAALSKDGKIRVWE